MWGLVQGPDTSGLFVLLLEISLELLWMPLCLFRSFEERDRTLVRYLPFYVHLQNTRPMYLLLLVLRLLLLAQLHLFLVIYKLYVALLTLACLPRR